MKKLLTLFAFVLVAFAAHAQSCPDGNHPHMIDLGLPSGAKWACCNVGADKPEDYGDYFAWGETKEKELYDWNTYTHCDNSASTCHDLGSDIARTQYDVAHVQWGGYWVMPLLEQIKELLENCTFQWIEFKEKNGMKLTSTINGKSIFLPAAGARRDGTLFNVGSCGYYWSSTQDPSNFRNACDFIFHSNGVDYSGVNNRSRGQSVRPVSSQKSAGGYGILVLWHADGTTTDVALYHTPKVEFTGDKLRITSYVLDMEFPKSDILRLTYKRVNMQDGMEIVRQKPDYRREGDRLIFHGVKSTDKVAVYTTDGKRVSVPLSASAEGVTLSLSSIPHGVYILNVNGKTSKFMRP